MSSRAVLPLLRGQLAHPFGAFPTTSWMASVANSVSLLPNSSPTSVGTSWSGAFDRFKGAYPQGLGIWGNDGVDVAALGLHSIQTALRAGIGGTNESERLRNLIIQNIYPTSSTDALGIWGDDGVEVAGLGRLHSIQTALRVGIGGTNESERLRNVIIQNIYPTSSTDVYPSIVSNATYKLSKLLFPGQPQCMQVRSFSSGRNFGEDSQCKELKRIGDAVEEILKLLQENSANKSSTTSPEAPSGTTKPQDEHVSTPAVFPAGPFGPRTMFLLSSGESIVKSLREWIPKENSAHVPLVMLQETITLAKDPATKAALDSIMQERSLKMLLQKLRKPQAGDYKNKEVILVPQSTVAALEPLRARVEPLKANVLKALALLDEYSTPLVIAIILAGVLNVLLQVTW